MMICISSPFIDDTTGFAGGPDFKQHTFHVQKDQLTFAGRSSDQPADAPSVNKKGRDKTNPQSDAADAPFTNKRSRDKKVHQSEAANTRGQRPEASNGAGLTQRSQPRIRDFCWANLYM
jgi:hypothetical protein